MLAIFRIFFTAFTIVLGYCLEGWKKGGFSSSKIIITSELAVFVDITEKIKKFDTYNCEQVAKQAIRLSTSVLDLTLQLLMCVCTVFKPKINFAEEKVTKFDQFLKRIRAKQLPKIRNKLLQMFYFFV